MSQIALRLIRSDTSHRCGPPHAEPDPRDLSDEDLLAHYLPNAGAFIAHTGGYRAALEQLSRAPERHADIAIALELGRRYVEASVNRGEALTSPNAARRALMARLRDRDHEVFVCLFLTARNHIIACEEMFRGSISAATVHVRDVVKRALELNAAHVLFAHNHVSGVPEPSRADRAITKRLIEALQLIDVAVLDHLVIGDGATVSFAERGLI